MSDLKTSWTNAEREVFEAIRSKRNDKENLQCFVGYLPINAPNVWMLTSGGNGDQFDSGLYKGSSPCHRMIRIGMQAVGIFADRSKAQQFAMQVIEVLAETNNFTTTGGNIIECSLSGMPTTPDLNEDEYWQIIVPMELVFDGIAN